MLKAIIVEDELNSQELLKGILEEYCEGVEVVDMAQGVGEAIEKIRKHKPDLIMLDIELSDGDGFQVLEKLADDELDHVRQVQLAQRVANEQAFAGSNVSLESLEKAHLYDLCLD